MVVKGLCKVCVETHSSINAGPDGRVRVHAGFPDPMIVNAIRRATPIPVSAVGQGVDADFGFVNEETFDARFVLFVARESEGPVMLG